MAEQVVTVDVQAVAQQLEAALVNKQTIPPLTETLGPLTPEQAYAIQTRWTELRVAAGERVIGRKIGLTSRAMQEQLGVRSRIMAVSGHPGIFPQRAVASRCLGTF